MSKQEKKVDFSLAKQMCFLSWNYSSSIVFLELDASAKEISIFHYPLDCAVEELLTNLQLELINLQCNDMLTAENQENNLI